MLNIIHMFSTVTVVQNRVVSNKLIQARVTSYRSSIQRDTSPGKWHNRKHTIICTLKSLNIIAVDVCKYIILKSNSESITLM